MKYLVSIFALAIVTGCELMPDSVSVGSRVDRYGRYDSTTVTMLYHNPWKPRKVHEEYISIEGADYQSDAQ